MKPRLLLACLIATLCSRFDGAAVAAPFPVVGQAAVPAGGREGPSQNRLTPARNAADGAGTVQLAMAGTGTRTAGAAIRGGLPFVVAPMGQNLLPADGEDGAEGRPSVILANVLAPKALTVSALGVPMATANRPLPTMPQPATSEMTEASLPTAPETAAQPTAVASTPPPDEEVMSDLTEVPPSSTTPNPMATAMAPGAIPLVPASMMPAIGTNIPTPMSPTATSTLLNEDDITDLTTVEPPQPVDVPSPTIEATKREVMRGGATVSVIPASAVTNAAGAAGEISAARMVTLDPYSSGGPELISLVVNGMTKVNLKFDATRVEAADPKIADVRVTSPRNIVLVGRGVGATQVMVQQGEQVQAFHVIVEPNNEALAAIIRSVVPTADVKIRSVNGRIILTGRVPDTESASRIADLAAVVQGGPVLNQLMVGGLQQTMLRVVVAEVSKSAMRELGVNWGYGGSPLSRDVFFANNLNQLNPTNFTSSGLANVRMGDLTYGLLPNVNGGNTNFTLGFPRIELQMFLDALRENSLARVMAEPNLVALTGQTATFLAGGEVPIPVTQGGAVAGAITIEYKEFGVRLAFTPTVLGHQKMRLHIMSEVSDAVPTNQIIGNLPVFTFTTRRVESTIECGNGQSFAIAGLLNDRVNAIASKIPGIGDIPVLGSLFSSVNYQRQQTELVVLVTPELVEPLDPSQVPTPPGGDMTEPNDFELFGLGKLEGAPAKQPEGETIEAHTGSREGSNEYRMTRAKMVGPHGFASAEAIDKP